MVVAQYVFGFLVVGSGVLLMLSAMYSPTWTRTWKDFRKGKFWAGLACALLGTLIVMAPIFPYIF